MKHFCADSLAYLPNRLKVFKIGTGDQALFERNNNKYSLHAALVIRISER